MTNMSKDEKRMMLFDMQEHPEKYTDEQVEHLLADEEVKEFFHELAMARMAGKKANPKDVDVDEAWKEFVQAHHEDKMAIDAGKSKGVYRNRMKIAASIVGIIFLSGVALAAIHNGWLGFSASDQAADNKAVTEQLATTQALTNDSLRAATAENKDSLDMKPVVFDDAELGTILAQLSGFYHVKVEYVDAGAQHIRLFFNWNKTKTLEQNLEILNAFDRIQIEYIDGTLTEKMIKILFADDDLKYSMLLKSFLQQHGYDVTYAGNGKKAWEQFPEVKPDLVLLDINMPEMDGYEVAERIRTIDPKVLIFFLTDRTEKNDRLKGFSLKANDYLAKPFYPEELLARIEERFSMNESETIEEEVYHFGETTFCYNNNELRTRSSRVLITSRQADILRLLAKNIGNVVSKEMIQEAVWGTVSYANSLAVNVQMTYLRHALQHDATVKIESLKKKGYVLSVISPE